MATPGEVCVDLGSGRGTDALRLAEKVGEEGFVYGIDTSDGMLNKARMNASKMQIANVAFIKSDLENISLPDETANLVISNCTINHASDKKKVWSEIFRILKKGGRFVVSDIYSIDPVPEEYRNDPVAVAECWAGAVTREEYMNTLLIPVLQGYKSLRKASLMKGQIKVASFTIHAVNLQNVVVAVNHNNIHMKSLIRKKTVKIKQ